MLVLALNAGGRSHRAQLYEIDEARLADPEPPPPVWHAENETASGGFAPLLRDAPQPDLAVHRIVHGGLGDALAHDAPIDDAVRAAIEDGAAFAAHNRLALDGIDAVTAQFPDLAQIAIVDRALRDDAPARATWLAGPVRWRSEARMRRFGFHGISHHDVIARVLARLGRTDARVITVHLGSGCSLAAFAGSRMIETTMGMTPLGGVVMTERTGDLDPGVLLHLMRSGADADALEHEIGHASGLLGLSGISGDTREVYAAIDAGDTRAALAMEIFIASIGRAIGALAAELGGLEALAFSGPIGEHMARTRAAACERLAFLGIVLDPEANVAAVADAEIGSPHGAVRAFVIRTLEEWAMVRRGVAVRHAPPR